MDIGKLDLVFFSPTGMTRRVMQHMGRQWTEESETALEEINVTGYEQRDGPYQFTENELAMFGSPSFGGRVPPTAAERFQTIRGKNTPAVLVVTYGNRAYDDTLLELRDIVRKNGFIPVAAVAAVTEHSIFHDFAHGRPDAQDKQELSGFAVQIKQELQGIRDIAGGVTLSLPGKRPYREYRPVCLHTEPGRQCSACGVCARECPVGAISPEDPQKLDSERCISCMRCTHVCPQHARSVNGIGYSRAHKKLKKACSVSKKNELFLSVAKK